MIDNYIDLCKYQRDLFEYASEVKKVNSNSFIKAFAYSSLAQRMDNNSFIFESTDIIQAYIELEKEKKIRKTNKRYPTHVMGWIGYLIRYWSLSEKISTKSIYKIINGKELVNLYEAYHSLDIDEAIKRIIESKEQDKRINNLDILKKIYSL